MSRAKVLSEHGGHLGETIRGRVVRGLLPADGFLDRDAWQRALVRAVDPGLAFEGAEITRAVRRARSIARSGCRGSRAVFGDESVLCVVERLA